MKFKIVKLNTGEYKIYRKWFIFWVSITEMKFHFEEAAKRFIRSYLRLKYKDEFISHSLYTVYNYEKI